MKGLRLVTAFGIAALLGTQPAIAGHFPHGWALSALAGGIALWSSVSVGRVTRRDSARDLVLLCLAAALGAAFTAGVSPVLARQGPTGTESALVLGAFLVGYLRRFGPLGTGMGSLAYAGQLLAYSLKLGPGDLPMIGAALLIAILASVVPRMLSGPAERPVPPSPRPSTVAAPRLGLSPEFVMGLQGMLGAAVIVALTGRFGLEQSYWAITASTYVVASTAAATVSRVRYRVIGTFVGVPLALACLPIAFHAPILIWLAAALAMVIFAMATPERYDIASGAFAFALIVTLAASGEHSIDYLIARLWETALGGLLGLASATLFLPLRPKTS